jgi:hypothetical protein
MIGGGGSSTGPVAGLSGDSVCSTLVYTSHRGDGVADAPPDAEGVRVRPAVLEMVGDCEGVRVAVALPVAVLVAVALCVAVRVVVGVAVDERVVAAVSDALPVVVAVGDSPDVPLAVGV